ncbi:DUF4232 domain-containing protein [Streptomyces sp. NPDC051776]|uniref:DUF4232 domain-containing protein n=1 Tax=Streptomyces sp. NPDC051776 TaxID=3155414 RepID=UPI0034392B15
MPSSIRATRRNRSLRIAAACLTAAAALSLTACNDDASGVRTSGDGGKSAVEQGSGGQNSQGTGGKSGGTGGSGKAGGTGGDSGTGTKSTGQLAACSPSTVRVEAQPVDRPVNHVVLTATNTSKTACNLYGHPLVSAVGDQAVMSSVDDSKPQAVITLAPGKTAYAGVALSAADGSGGNGRETENFSVSLAGAKGSGGSGRPVIVPAPGGKAHVDDSARVTYWLAGMEDALAW